MVDEKDRMGEKLHQKEKADEDRFFAERDKALLEKLRREPATTSAPAQSLCPKTRERDSWLGRLFLRPVR